MLLCYSQRKEKDLAPTNNVHLPPLHPGASGGLISTVAQDIRLQVKACPGFKIHEVLTNFNQKVHTQKKVASAATAGGGSVTTTTTKSALTTVQMRDVYSEEKRDVLVKVKLDVDATGECPTPCRSPSPVGVVQFEVKYESLLSGTKEVIESQCAMVMGERDQEEKPNVKIQEQRARLEATDALNAARAQAEGGDVTGAQESLKKCRLHIQHVYAKQNQYVDAVLFDMLQVERAIGSDTVTWGNLGCKTLAQVQSRHEQQRMNLCEDEVTAAGLGYDNKWKQEMREKSRAVSPGMPERTVT